jgi:hypothetical protein
MSEEEYTFRAVFDEKPEPILTLRSTADPKYTGFTITDPANPERRLALYANGTAEIFGGFTMDEAFTIWKNFVQDNFRFFYESMLVEIEMLKAEIERLK